MDIRRYCYNEDRKKEDSGICGIRKAERLTNQKENFPSIYFYSFFCIFEVITTIQMKIIGNYIDYTKISPVTMTGVFGFWFLGSVIFTVFTGQQMRKKYTEPLEEIADAGYGMNERVIKHIFDKFYQGDESHTTFGNGLGVALVKRVLELSDASITVESTPEKGSVFTVILEKNHKKKMK